MNKQNKYFGLLVAGALSAGSLFVAGSAHATPVAGPTPYSDGLQLLVADKLFTFNSCEITGTGAAGSPIGNCAGAGLVVAPRVDPGLIGFAMLGAVIAANGSVRDIALSYTVDVLDPNQRISDAHLVLVGSADTGGVMHVDEIMRNGTTPEAEINVAGVTSLIGNAVTVDLLSHLDVSKDILLIAGGTPDSTPPVITNYSIMIQEFSQTSVPEPVTMTVFGLALAGLGLIRRKRT